MHAKETIKAEIKLGCKLFSVFQNINLQLLIYIIRTCVNQTNKYIYKPIPLWDPRQ